MAGSVTTSADLLLEQAQSPQAPSLQHAALFALGMADHSHLVALSEVEPEDSRRKAQWWRTIGPALHDDDVPSRCCGSSRCSAATQTDVRAVPWSRGSSLTFLTPRTTVRSPQAIRATSVQQRQEMVRIESVGVLGQRIDTRGVTPRWFLSVALTTA